MSDHEYVIIWFAGGHLYTVQDDNGAVVTFSHLDLAGVVEPADRHDTIDGIAVAQADPTKRFAVPLWALEDFLGREL